ncbi:MAG: hypothetical protein A3J38_05985 [Gammaproteobacteria bacterium RIFCSPHIGHO2_12_FULL_45_9]|nr:MAG: hypothetical protein A3J38_05985 [Gammaproteobacteria bacterium RIFCSPHIGHO2_12_FULL_45_9]
MFRSLMQDLVRWKDRSDRSPLLLRGARQVGKSFLVEQFAVAHSLQCVTINFEHQPEYAEFFEATLDAKRLVRSIELLSRKKLVPGQSLLFLDEIQECPRAIQALRYFKEQLPELHVIGAGSLLEFVLNDTNFRMPVGRVEFLYLKPLSFHEFLMAAGQTDYCDFLAEVQIQDTIPTTIHQDLLDWVKRYWAVGGMPAVVNSFITEADWERCQALQAFLLQTYRDDFGKYATKTQHAHLQKVFAKLPGVVTKQFKYVDFDRELRAENIRHALHMLGSAGLLTQIHATSAAGLPLSADAIEKKFKLLFLDVGLLNRACFIPPESLLMRQPLVNQGSVTEQFVGQELLCLQATYEPSALYFWQRDTPGSQAEVDYLLAEQGLIIPIEVKSGHSRRLKSLHMLMAEKHLPLGVRISESPLAYHDALLSIPLYLIHELPRLLQRLN